MKKWIKRVLGAVIFLVLCIFLILEITHQIQSFRMNRLFENHEILDYRLIETSSGNLAIREYGDSENDVIVLIHGFMGSSYDYRKLSELLKTDYYIVAIDLIGFGFSDKPSDFDYTRTNHALLIHEVMTSLEIDTYIIGGHSMGGEVSIRHAALYPEHVTHLLLFASVGPSTEPREQSTLPIFFYRFIFKNYLLQRFAFNTAYYSDAYKNNTYYHPMFYINKAIPPRTIQAYSNASDEDNLVDIISQLTIPTLIIYGEQDSWTPKTIGDRLNQSIVNSELVIIPNSGHLLIIESSTIIASHIYSFLKNG